MFASMNAYTLNALTNYKWCGVHPPHNDLATYSVHRVMHRQSNFNYHLYSNNIFGRKNVAAMAVTADMLPTPMSMDVRKEDIV